MTSAVSFEHLPDDVLGSICTYIMPSRHFPSVNKKCANLAELWFEQHISSNCPKPNAWPLSNLCKQIQTGMIFGHPLKVVTQMPCPGVQIVRKGTELIFTAGGANKVISINENSTYTTRCRPQSNFTLVHARNKTIIVCYNNNLTSFCEYTISSSIPIPEGTPWCSHDHLIAWRDFDGTCYVFDWRANQLLSSFPVISKQLYDVLLFNSDFLVIWALEELAVYHWKTGSRLDLELPRFAGLPQPNDYGLDGERLVVYHGRELSVYDLSKKRCVFTKDMEGGLFTRVYRDMLFHVSLYNSSDIRVFHIPTQQEIITQSLLGGVIRRLWIEGYFTMHVITDKHASHQSVENCLTLDVQAVDDNIFTKIQQVHEKFFKLSERL
jgi:hypothetical protein